MGERKNYFEAKTYLIKANSRVNGVEVSGLCTEKVANHLKERRQSFTLRKLSKFYLISWCGKFVETYNFRMCYCF